MKRGRRHLPNLEPEVSCKKVKLNDGNPHQHLLKPDDAKTVCVHCESYLNAAISSPSQCLTEMTEILDSACDPSPSTLTNQKALFYAIGQGHAHCVKELLKTCNEVNSTQYAGISPLHLCAGAGHVDVMEELINQGADVNLQLQTDSLSPLHISASFGSVECVELLLKNGADPMQQTSNSSMNAIHFAAYHGRVECLKVFVKYHCDINLPSEQSGRTALHYAAVRGEVDCFLFLLQNNADLSVLDLNGHSAIVYAANAQQGQEIVKYFPLPERRKWLSVSLVSLEDSIHICSERGESVPEFKKIYSQLQNKLVSTKNFERVPMFHLSFLNEIGAGLGVVREWFAQLPEELIRLGIFSSRSISASEGLYFAHQSPLDDQMLFHGEICGALLALGLIHGHTIPLKLAFPIYKLLLGAEILPEDLAGIDLEYYKHKICYLQQCSEEELLELELSFVETEQLSDGLLQDVDLLPGGSEIPVTLANREEYIRLLCKHKMFFQRQELIQRFVTGFHRLIPLEILHAAFTGDALQLRSAMVGDLLISVPAWKEFTKYENCSESSTQVTWFWQSVEKFSNEEREALLEFCTGTRSLPVGGFRQLALDKMPFTLHLLSSGDCLPSSRTCFNTLLLPCYDNFESFFQKLKYVLSVSVKELGFGFV